MSLQIKTAGVYAPITTLYQKMYGTYFPANQIYVKELGVYVPQGYSWNNGPAINAIIPVGSSTTLYAFDNAGSYNINQTPFVRQRFCEMGIDLPVITNVFAMDGGTTTSGAATIDAALASINATGIAAKGIVIGFPINLGNNDVVTYRYDNTIYPTAGDTTAAVTNLHPVATDSYKNQMIANLRYIVNAIYASGHQPMLGTINPRGGDSVFADFQKWNTYLYKPLITEITPQWINSDGNPVYDMEWLYHFWHSTYTYAQWYDTDGTHPSLIAIDKIQRYLAQSWGRYAQSPRLTNQTHSIIIAFSGSYIYPRGGINQIVTNPIGPVQTASQTGLYDRRGILHPDASFSVTGQQSFSATSKGNLGVWSIGLENNYIQKSLTYNYNGTPLNVDVSLGVTYAGRTGTVKVTLATGNWGSTYTVQGHSSALRGQDAGPQIATFPVTLDSSGTVRVVCTRGYGNYYAGISGLELIID